MQQHVLSVERLSREEMHALDAAQIVASLWEIIEETAFVGKHMRPAIISLRDARKALILADKRDPDAYAQAKCGVEDAKAMMDVIKDRAKTLREIKMAIQSVLAVERKIG